MIFKTDDRYRQVLFPFTALQAKSLILTTVLLVGTISSRNALGKTPPFVAGFDRFARHGQIDLETGGKLLLAELSCTACHSSKDQSLKPKPGPNLNGAGSRFQTGWVEKYLDNPQGIKPGTTMPDMLQSLSPEEKKESIAALSAFLTSKHQPFPKLTSTGVHPLALEFWRKGNPSRGIELYHQIGCVACHEPNKNYDGGSSIPSQLDKQLDQLDPEDIEELGFSHVLRPVNSIPLPNLKEKYNLKSLLFFLLNPESVRLSGRMPNLKLRPLEAADLAAYLLKDQQIIPENKPSAALIKKGSKLFTQLKCANCHEAGGLKPTGKATPLANLKFPAENCIAKPSKNTPHYDLDKKQTEAIQRSIKDLNKKDLDKKQISQSKLDFHLLKLNCFACHERNNKGGLGRNKKNYFETVGHVDIGDEGRFPPTLTHLGTKMHQGWMKKVLEGKEDLRPFMTIRMPRFPAKMTAALPQEFATADEFKKSSEKEVFGDLKGLAEEGRKLLDTGCIQCHQLKGETAPGVVGVELAGIASRVHPNWFYDFLLDPASLKHRTRMPTFFPEGKSSNKVILKGDVNRQIAALWVYLKEIDKHPLPEKILAAKSRNTELVPKEHPILLRTFMKEAGTHAIAVGFPEKFHYAFDAESVRLTQAWKGQFLDAEGTWYIRFAPPAIPLGKNLISMPAGNPFARLTKPDQNWPVKNHPIQFLGYQLDKKKIPTFVYRIQNHEIHDRIFPDGNKGFSRTIRTDQQSLQSGKGDLWFLLNSGKKLRRNNPGSYTNPSGLTTVLSENLDKQAILRKQKDQSLWILPLKSINEFEVKYQW